MTTELDGRPVTSEQLEVLALTGYGHFTSMRSEAGRVRGLDLHLRRLARDARTLFGVDLDTDRVRQLVRRVAPSVGDVVIRVTVFDPQLSLGEPEKATDPRILVTTRTAGSPALPPIRVRSCVHERDLPATKSTGLFATIAHRRATRLAGYDDVLFTTRDGIVTEGATWNIGFFDGTGVVWPKGDVLDGVTMDLLAAGDHDTRQIRVSDLATFPVAFATNAAVGVRAIAGIDEVGYDVGHPLIDDLRARYLAVEPDLL